MKLNINSEATVILTDYGAKIYNRYYKKMYVAPSAHAQFIDAFIEGDVLKIELWHLMQIFGEHLWNGNPNTPFKDNSLTISVAR